MTIPRTINAWLAKELIEAAQFARVRSSDPAQRMWYVATYLAVYLPEESRAQFDALVYESADRHAQPITSVDDERVRGG